MLCIEKSEFRDKITNTERVVSMLIEQLNNVERSQQGELRKYKVQLDSEREYRMKLESSLRLLQDQVTTTKERKGNE